MSLLRRENEPVFHGYFVQYACPFCRGPKDMGGYGQSLIWIATECIARGDALTSCSSCEQHFRIPGRIFANGVLHELATIAKRDEEQGADTLWSYVQSKYVATNNQRHLLQDNWYQILLDANRAGPVDVAAMPWKPGQPCPLCTDARFPIAFTYACPYCKHRVSVPQQVIDMTRGVLVACPNCMRQLSVPPSVWCPKCSRALLDYYSVLRRIAGANGVDLHQLIPEEP